MTRNPDAYWNEALSRDPSDARSNNAMGLQCLRRGQFAAAESTFGQRWTATRAGIRIPRTASPRTTSALR